MKKLLIILALVFLASCQDLQAENLDGGYKLVRYDPSDQTQALVLSTSQEAIKQNSDLISSDFTFVRVLKLETQVVEGVNYRITLLYGNQEHQKKVIQAVVWSQPWLNKYEVTSVTDLSSKLPKLPVYGNPKLPKIGSEPNLEILQKSRPFQVGVTEVESKYHEDLNGYTLTEAKLVSTQVVAGMIYTYELTFTKQDQIPQVFQVQVWSKPWENFNQVVQITPANRRLMTDGSWKNHKMDLTNSEDKLVFDALNEYSVNNQQLGMSDYQVYSFGQVQTQIVAGTNYKLQVIYQSPEHTAPVYVEAIVWVQAWMNQATVTQFNVVNGFVQQMD